MTKPQTIQIFLPTGNPRGIRQAEVTTRTLRVFDVPRSDIKTFFQMSEAEQIALYFLFGEPEPEEGSQCYIGQTGSVKQRFVDHLNKKDFWNRAVIAVSSNNSLTVTHAHYLEARAIELANAAGRFTLTNGTSGSQPHTPAPLQADCEDVLETVRLLLGTLGYPVLEPLSRPEEEPTQTLLYCTARGAEARGYYTSEGLVVLEGSKCSPETAPPKSKPNITALREKLLNDGVLELIDGIPMFAKRYAFNTPSAASCQLTNRASNGWVDWKDKDGNTLHEVSNRELEKPEAAG